jgi:hypothetical protein
VFLRDFKTLDSKKSLKFDFFWGGQEKKSRLSRFFFQKLSSSKSILETKSFGIFVKRLKNRKLNRIEDFTFVNSMIL